MLQVAEHLDALLDDVVRLLAADVRNEPDAAGVVLVGRVVESLPLAPPIALMPLPLLRRPCVSDLPIASAAQPTASSGGSAIRARSMCVESTTIVSVRETPSSERTRSIRSSSVSVLLRLDLEHQRVRARDVVTLEHFVHRRHRDLDSAHRDGPVGRDADERGHVETEAPRVEQRGVGPDHAGFLELVDAFEHRGCGEPDLLSDGRERLLTVLLQQVENGLIGGVELQGHAAELH